MKKSTIAVLLLLAALLALLPSCSKAPEETIIGTWVATGAGVLGADNTYVFNEGGTGTHNTTFVPVNITYSIEEDKITIAEKVLGITTTTTIFTFELSGDTLKLTDGSTTTTFTRKAETTEAK